MMLEKLYQLVRRFEGLRLQPYLCPAGVPTVGYGHTGPDVTMKSPPISATFAEKLMKEDVERYAAAALKLSPTLAIYPDRHCGIGDFCFNLGTTRYKGSTLRRKVRDGEWLDAVEEMEKWIWGGGRKLPGLVLRRHADAALLA